MAALWWEIKELDAAFCVSEVTLVRLILFPDIELLETRLAGYWLSLMVR